jgi:hypothetical protein
VARPSASCGPRFSDGSSVRFAGRNSRGDTEGMRTRLALGVVLASLLCVAAAAAVALTWDRGSDAPPALSARMVRVLGTTTGA